MKQLRRTLTAIDNRSARSPCWPDRGSIFGKGSSDSNLGGEDVAVAKFDCVIVGAGPAGSSAAYHLSRRGITVLLLDQATFPRNKPCTGAVSPRIAEWFDFDFAPALETTERRIRYTWKLGDEVAAELKTQEPIWLVKRDKFDQFLVEQAIAQGTTFQDGTAVTGLTFTAGQWQIQTPAETFHSDYLVAADGGQGPIAGWLGLKQPSPRAAAMYTLSAPLPTDYSALNFEFGLLKNGCLWCFPQTQGTVMGALSLVGNEPADFETTFAAYTAGLMGPDFPGECHSCPVQLWDGHYPRHTQQAVVVGEAAAIVDPLSAEGIRHGLYSGMKGAEAIASALAGNAAALAGYTDAMTAWGNNMQWAQRIAGVFFRVPGIGYRVGIKRPTMTKRMGQLLTGEIQYSDIANRVIKRLTTGFLPGRS
ncbi:MAG: geranylgeranyl reductase family protein [Leptolyngbyaceae cyanobacterium]